MGNRWNRIVFERLAVLPSMSAGISTLLMRPGGAAVANAAKGEKEPATVTERCSAGPGDRTARPEEYGLSTYVPLFDAGLRHANREAAKGQVLEEKASCVDVGMKVKRDVAAAWLTLQTAATHRRLTYHPVQFGSGCSFITCVRPRTAWL
jgi:hypothetical protein